MDKIDQSSRYEQSNENEEENPTCVPRYPKEIHVKKKFKIQRKRLIREFERRGLPWIYDGKPEPEIGKFEERPEMEDTVKNKLLRIEEIKENLLRNDEEIYQYRKEMINARKYGKFAKVVDELFPSWVSNVRRKNSEGGAARED